jgi:hypothetical protein
MLNNGEKTGRDEDPKRVKRAQRRLKRMGKKVGKLEKKASQRRVDVMRKNEKTLGSRDDEAGTVTNRYMTLRPTGKAKRAEKKLDKLKKKGKIKDYSLTERAEATKDVQSLPKARLRRKRKVRF